MKHSKKPFEVQSSEFDEMLRAKMKDVLSSSYYEYVAPLKQLVIGKMVARTQAGTSGFVIFFIDNDWVAVYLQDKKLCWKYEQGDLPNELTPKLNSSEYGDGFQPLSVDLPYADQTCDINHEITRAHGREITGIAIGKEDFNFCFPDGLELDANIVPTSSGKYALRVYWEQW